MAAAIGAVDLVVFSEAGEMGALATFSGHVVYVVLAEALADLVLIAFFH